MRVSKDGLLAPECATHPSRQAFGPPQDEGEVGARAGLGLSLGLRLRLGLELRQGLRLASGLETAPVWLRWTNARCARLNITASSPPNSAVVESPV